ncbi:MAG TPA: DUF1501 domain-containing protein [Myxococcales bacterium]|nr:DUF1501 domain-containing protein [Myxococcales bacterium]
MALSRREWLGAVGLGFAAASLPSFARRALAEAPRAGKLFVLIFQRGAADALSVVPPLLEPRYRLLRPTIALPAKGEGAPLPLDGFFGLHPSLAPLLPHFKDGTLAIVHQVGSPDPTRSHFDAQDYYELGTPGQKGDDGFLDRALADLPEDGKAPFRAVALQPTLPVSLMGPVEAVAVNELAQFHVGPASGSFEAMYRSAVDSVLRGASDEAFAALHSLASSGALGRDAEVAAGYPKGGLGRRLYELAALVKSGHRVQIAATDIGGWDTHVGQGTQRGQLSNRLRELGSALAAFARDLGPRFADVCVAVVTEFGRTVRENGTHGTDHGHGSVMLVLGGAVRGGRVHARWKPLDDHDLFEGRDLPVTTDFRAPLSSMLTGHLGVADVRRVFPGFALPRAEWPRLI